MEYSNEFLRKLFTNYIDCEVRVLPPSIFNDLHGVTGYLTGIHGEYEAEIQLLQDGNVSEEPEYTPFYQTKLLLTPLSAITDEDAIEVAKIIGCNIPLVNSYGLQGEITYIVKRNDKGVSVGIYRVGGNLNEVVRRIYFDDRNLLNTEQADYLRSKAYDCGYAEIPSLIYAGLAIDKTTLNK